MRLETRQNLADIIASGQEILGIGGEDGVRYRTIRVEGLAVERLFLILGEALVRIRESEPEVLNQITASAEIIGFRNLLAHGYDQIDADRVVVIIRRWLPILVGDAQRLLAAAADI